MMNKKKVAISLSPLSLLTLTACGGSGQQQEAFGTFVSTGGSTKGFAWQGPLSNASLYIDYDDAALGNSAMIRTNSDGSYVISTLNDNYTIVVVTDDSTLDMSAGPSGTLFSGVTMKARAGSTSVSTATTIMEEGSLTSAQLNTILGLSADIDHSTFNAFATGVNAGDALAVEKASKQFFTVVNAFTAAVEGSGASHTDAFETALKAVVDVITLKAGQVGPAGQIDFTDNAIGGDLKDIQGEVTTALNSGNVSNANAALFTNVIADATALAVMNVNSLIANIADLNSVATKNIFSLSQVLEDQVLTAVSTSTAAEITFDAGPDLANAKTNKTPTDITLSSASMSEADASLLVGTASTIDVDQTGGVAFSYSVPEFPGSDNASFTIVEATGALSFKFAPDFETKKTYVVTILSTDEGGKTFTKSFQITVTDANEAPTVANAIADQTIAEDSALSFQFNTNTFVDADVGDTSTYTATLSNGNSLPAWLTFNASTQTFTGTPLNGDVGTIAVRVTATDSGNATVFDTFNITVANTNDAPTVANAIADQTIAEDSALSFQFNTNVFADVDVGDTITFTATLSDGNLLPTWLTFNASTRTFSGTPVNADVGVIAVKVTATDTAGTYILDTFNITITNTNDAPTVANAIADQTIAEDSALSFQFNTNVFADVDVGDTFTYTATLSNGNSLPAWLTFNASTQTFTGTPLNGDVGTIAVRVTATDSGNATVFDTFNITVANTNDAPTVANAIADQSFSQDSASTFQFNTNVFADVDVGDTLTYSAVEAGGNSLPSWLSFDAATRIFSGTPLAAGTDDLTITVTATDSAGGTQSDTFNLTVIQNQAPSNLALNSNTVAENADGATIGTLSAFDADGDAITYSLASGGNNDYFEIVSGTTLKLKSGVSGNYELDNSYLITVNATDGSFTTSLDTLINVTNVNEANASTHNAKADAALSATLNAGNDAAVENLMSGHFWGVAGRGIDLNYSFMTTSSSFNDTQYASQNKTAIKNGVQNASTELKAAVVNAFEDFSSVSLLNFTEVADDGNGVGHLRFGSTTVETSGFAWYPSPNWDPSGDVWLNSIGDDYNDAALLKDGTYWNTTITHEIGHAVGLAHTQDASQLNARTYGSDTTTGSIHNSNPYSAMAYAEFDGDSVGNGKSNMYSSYTTLMIDDIAAIQHLYGVNEQYKTGNDVYTLGSFDEGTTVADNYIYATIWDAGGTDTISWATQSTVASINLAAGGYCYFGDITSTSDTDLGDAYFAAGSGILGIAHNVVIENAIGGSALDTVVGNSAANILYGGSGAGIKDTLTGNGGADTFVCSLTDAVTTLALADTITDFTNGTDLIGLEDRQWSDLTIANSSGNTKIIDTSSNKVLFVLDTFDFNLIDSTDFVVTDFV